MITVIVVDDENIARRRLVRLLEETGQAKVVAECARGLGGGPPRRARGGDSLDRGAVRVAGARGILRPHDIDWGEPAGNYFRLPVGRANPLFPPPATPTEPPPAPRHFLRIRRRYIV